MKWETINNTNFLNAIKKLRQNEAKVPVEARFRLGCISMEIYFEQLKAQKQAMVLLDKYAKKDADGKVIGVNEEPPKIEFETKELEEQHDADFKMMLETKFKIDANPIEVSALEEVPFTADELLALRPILQDH
jgi:hypothetical protein